jgi:hypothetical protein
MAFAVTTEDGEEVGVSDVLAGDEWRCHEGTYIRNGNELIGVRKMNTPAGQRIVCIYYLLDPQTDVFVLAGMTKAGLNGFDFKIQVVGEIAGLTEGGSRPDRLNQATLTLASPG